MYEGTLLDSRQILTRRKFKTEGLVCLGLIQPHHSAVFLTYFIFAMLDATDSYVKSEKLYKPKFDPFFKDQTILSISGATPQYWYMYCVGPPPWPHHGPTDLY